MKQLNFGSNETMKNFDEWARDLANDLNLEYQQEKYFDSEERDEDGLTPLERDIVDDFGLLLLKTDNGHFRWHAECKSCKEYTEIHCDLSEFNDNHYCGRDQHCIP